MKQVRNTIAKTRILSLFKESEVALSHSEIQNALHDICDRVTIYRILGRLTDENIIHKIVDIDGQTKYAICKHCSSIHKHNHLHFSCKVCKTITCIENVEPSFSLPTEYKVFEVNFSVTGICPKCSE